MSGPNLLVCNRVDARRLSAPIRGAMQKSCADCGAGIWVSVGSLATIAAAGPVYALLCMECGGARVRASGKLQVMPPSEEQLAEIARELELRRAER